MPDVLFSPVLPQREFGSTGLQCSVLGLGTVKIGRNTGVKYPQAFALPSDEAVRNLLAQARESGINLLDTAPAYGHSEERLGQLADCTKGFLICTKVGEEFDGANSHFDFSASHVRHSIERSLQRLQREVLDIVLVHSDGNDDTLILNSDILPTLATLKQQGKLRAFGVSTKTVAGGLLALAHSDGVMATLNLQQQDELPVFARAVELRKGVLVKKALASGHALARTTNQPTTPDDAVQQSLALCLSQAATSSIIIGTINPGHLADNIRMAVQAHTTLPA